jgi:hypothetical protein
MLFAITILILDGWLARIAQGHKGRALPPFQDMNEGLSQARDIIAIRPVKSVPSEMTEGSQT